MAYYGFERVASYTIAETTAGLAFFAALAAAAVHPTALTMALPWVVHPVVFSLVAVFHFRPIGSGGSQFPARPYLTYGLSWLASSAAGIAAYHLGIVATGVGLDDPQQVAYYSVSLSLLSPLTFFPITLSMVLFPRMAAHAAVAGDRSNAELLRISTLALLVGVLATGCVITALTPEILRWSNLPESKSMCAVLQILFFGIGLSLIATPAGSYLSATHYARLSAAIGLSSLMMGLLFWLTFIPSLGLVGSALGYAVLTTARAVGTLLASHHYGKWLPRLALRHLFAALLPVGMVLSVQADYSVGVRAVATAGAWLLLGLLLFPEIAAVVHRAIGSRLLRRESLNV
jgi:O-antigen/teichoic acid export membrane protein